MARKTVPEAPPPVNPRLVCAAMAKAVCDGDIVNFRLLFSPFSPARDDSSEQFETDKYAYLLPDAELEKDAEFKQALAAVERVEVHAHIEQELTAHRPAQLPSDLIILLGDNAVRTGKYSSAAQAYESVRIRRRMQEEFFTQADAALDQGAVAKAVRGYLIATGLAYEYAAFPEPLPVVPDYQTRALLLHAEYPRNPGDCVAMQEAGAHAGSALAYLLQDAGAAARLESRPLETQVGFAVELVRQIDPGWPRFAARYREAYAMVRLFGERFARAEAQAQAPGAGQTLAEEIEEAFGEDPRRVTAQLLGRTIPDGEWWQYLKELAYVHPASALFVARLLVGDSEVLVPRYRPDSPLAAALALAGE